MFLVSFILDELALEQVFLRAFLFFPLIIILSLLHTHLSEVCDGHDRAAHYHILGLEIRGFISVLALGWLQSWRITVQCV
jgi:hypothetical protein